MPKLKVPIRSVSAPERDIAAAKSINRQAEKRRMFTHCKLSCCFLSRHCFSIFFDYHRCFSIFNTFRRFSSIFIENLGSCIWPLGAMYRNQGFRRFSLIFFGFLRFSSGFVDFRPPFSSVFFDVLRFSSVSGMDLERSCLDLGTGSELNLGWI